MTPPSDLDGPTYMYIVGTAMQSDQRIRRAIYSRNRQSLRFCKLFICWSIFSLFCKQAKTYINIHDKHVHSDQWLLAYWQKQLNMRSKQMRTDQIILGNLEKLQTICAA